MIEIYNMSGEGGAEFQIGRQEAGGTTPEVRPIKAQALKDIRSRMQKPETSQRVKDDASPHPQQAGSNPHQVEREEDKVSGFEPAPEPEAKKLSDAIADNPEHAASLFRNINPESDEGKKLDEEANDLMEKRYEERNKPEEEQDKAQLKQWEDRLQNIFSEGEAPVIEEEKPAPTHPDDEVGKGDEPTGEQGGDTGGEEVPEAPVDENAPPAPREEEEELGTMKQEFEDITAQEKDGLISQEDAQEKAKNLLARLLGDKEKYKKGWRITKWTVYWAVVATAIAYIWSLKTIGGGVAKAGGRK